MNQHPQTTTLTCLIYAERFERQGLEEQVHVVLDRYLQDWTEERKADLYALLAERLTDGMRLLDAMPIVSRALWDNENRWAGHVG